MRKKTILAMAACLAAAVFTGCSARHLQKSGDAEVRSIMEEKSGRIPEETLPDEAIAAEDEEAPEPLELSLGDALALSASNNRTYQSRREDVYLNVLDLTYRRHQHGTRFRVSGSGGWEGGGEGDDSVSGRFNARLLRWLATGAEITFDITHNLLKYLTGDRDTDIHTIISMNLVQPLLKGAGREIAREALVQAERDAVYAIRSFARYQKEFSVDATDRYLNLLLLQNRERNFFNNYESLKRTRERIEMLSMAGRLPAMQVDQARQNEYNAYQRWINAANRFETAMDNFKMYLGLSPDTPVTLDEGLLEYFIEAGIDDIEIDFAYYLERALRRRLDLITQYDRLEDAQRKLYVASNQLRTGLDFRAGAGSRTESRSSPSLAFQTPRYSAGLELDVPVDRVAERNQYMAALIAAERMEREFRNKKDAVKLEITQQQRNLEEAYRSYVIQKNSLDLARDRIESTSLLMEAGRATTRDLLEAEESYLSAQNELAAEIINHAMAYLRFLLSAESLEVDEDGVWRGGIYEKVFKKDS